MTTAATGAVTIDALRRRVTVRLRAAFAGRGAADDPAVDARLLVAHGLGLSPGEVVLAGDRPLGEGEEAAVLALAERRAGGEPVARITGRKDFWTFTLGLSPETLVPRPDTETVVEAALGAVDAAGRRDSAFSILDLGTGSGAILLALLSELPRASGLGIDRSMGAAATAHANARRLGLAERARFAVGDWAAAVAGRFDIVVANPPYIVRDEIRGLPIEVGGHDPHMALDGGPDGLDAIRAISSELSRLLAPSGAAFLEVGAGQAAGVVALAAGEGLLARIHRDLGQIDRVVEIRPRAGDG